MTYFNDVSSFKAVELKKNFADPMELRRLIRKRLNEFSYVLGLSTTGHAITESKVLTDHLSPAQIEVLHVPDVDILDYNFF